MEKQIVSFELAKINRGKQKICKCENPHYEIDTTNRLVMCLDCGAIIYPFEALYNFTKRNEEIEEKQLQMKDKAKFYYQEANKEIKRMIKNRTFREMNEQYKKGMWPVCPNCGEPFDAMQITQWTNKNFIIEKVKGV